MKNRLLLVSTLDSQEPFGAFTRPFYLGQYLSAYFEVCQLGLDCSAVEYSQSVSVGSRSLSAYIQAIETCCQTFQPNLIYAQETLPSIAALIAVVVKKTVRCPLIFDFHTLSAFEYWTRLNSAPNRGQELKQLIKTYIAQGVLIFSGKTLIVAGEPILKLIPKWYKTTPRKIYSIGNGVPEDLITAFQLKPPDPYPQFRPAKIAVVIAPKTFQFPSNDMSVEMTIQIARKLEKSQVNVHFIIIGRQAEQLANTLPRNITFVGFLPSRSDFIAHLVHADFGLLPFPKQAVAGGARNKALDYLALQKLVISTPEGLRGLEEFQPQKHLLMAEDTIESMANLIQEAVENCDRYQPLIDNAYELIKNRYSWQAKAQKVAEILQLELQK